MTVKEIAQSTETSERTVRRWIERLRTKCPQDGDSLSAASGFAEKMSEAGHGKAADFDVDETCRIIEAGLGKNAAALFRANAQMIAGTAISTPDMAAMLEAIKSALKRPETPLPVFSLSAPGGWDKSSGGRKPSVLRPLCDETAVIAAALAEIGYEVSYVDFRSRAHSVFDTDVTITARPKR